MSNGGCVEYPTPCDVPFGWTIVDECPVNTSETPALNGTNGIGISANGSLGPTSYAFMGMAIFIVAAGLIFLYVATSSRYAVRLKHRKKKSAWRYEFNPRN
jgi:hypothetical protein